MCVRLFCCVLESYEYGGYRYSISVIQRLMIQHFTDTADCVFVTTEALLHTHTHLFIYLFTYLCCVEASCTYVTVTAINLQL